MTAGQKWPTVEAYYEADPRRRVSRESDLGVWWIEGDMRWPVYRVTTVAITGEVIAVCSDARHPTVEVLGYVTADPAADMGLSDGRDFMAPVLPFDEADRLLPDWPERCGQPGGLAWIRAQLATEPTEVVA